jgi:hypothetical protein
MTDRLIVVGPMIVRHVRVGQTGSPGYRTLDFALPSHGSSDTLVRYELFKSKPYYTIQKRPRNLESHEPLFTVPTRPPEANEADYQARPTKTKAGKSQPSLNSYRVSLLHQWVGKKNSITVDNPRQP